MLRFIKFCFEMVFYLILFLVAFSIALNLTTKPSNDKDWALDQKVLPEINFTDENTVSIKNIRNFSYKTTTDYTPGYYDKTFDVEKISKVYFIMEPFSGYAGAAHTLLSFEFDDKSYLSISVEIRKEKGESFSAVKGLLNRYELTYVIADERDVLKLRSNIRKDDVFVYPVKTSKEKAQKLFVDMLKRADKLAKEPEFYNTIYNTCTTNIVFHANKLREDKIGFNYKILFPAHSDELAYTLGLIDTELSFEEARKKFKINDRAIKYADDPEFSTKIRE